MKILIELNAVAVRKLVMDHLHHILGDVDFKPDDVKIECKSKQNFKSEWEECDFRAKVDKIT